MYKACFGAKLPNVTRDQANCYHLRSDRILGENFAFASNLLLKYLKLM